MAEPQCLGHANEFQHLNADLDGLEATFDLGFKFEERESNNFGIDPNTEVKVWAEPYLALDISFTLIAAPWETPRTLSYGLTRSKWRQKIASGEADRQHLLDRAKPHIQRDLQAVQRGESPAALSEPGML